MRKKVFSAALGFCLFTAVIAVTVFAQQATTDPCLRATIPFDFNVRGKTLPAGSYEIRRVNDDMPNLLVISNLKQKERAVFETENVDPKTFTSKGEFIFHRYGDSYFLSEVFSGYGETGRELTPSRQERTLRREMASNKAKPETVALAAD